MSEQDRHSYLMQTDMEYRKICREIRELESIVNKSNEQKDRLKRLKLVKRDFLENDIYLNRD